MNFNNKSVIKVSRIHSLLPSFLLDVMLNDNAL